MEGRKNVVCGFLFLALFMALGFVLGYLHDLSPGKEQWVAQYAAGTHFELRLAHVHGALFGLINVAIGMLLMKLSLRGAAQRAISWLALAGLLLPVGMLAHALLGVPPVLVFAGGLAMIVATLWAARAAFGLASERS